MTSFFRKEWIANIFAEYVGEQVYASDEYSKYLSLDETESSPSFASFKKGFSKGFLIGADSYAITGLDWDESFACFNYIGYLVTYGLYWRSLGMQETFIQSVCDAIGGYPKGSVLKVKSNRYVENSYHVISMQDNNTKNFNVFDPSISNSSPYEINSADEDGIVWWKRVTPCSQQGYCSILPDLTAGTAGLKNILQTQNISMLLPQDGYKWTVPNELGTPSENLHYMRTTYVNFRDGVLVPMVSGADWSVSSQFATPLAGTVFPPKLISLGEDESDDEEDEEEE